MALPGRFFLRRKMASMLRRSTVEGEEVCEEVLCEEIFWPDAKAEAEMYLLTASARATVLKERQDKARSELRKMARDALFDRACRVIQRAARAASARAASSRPRAEEIEESKSFVYFKSQALADPIHAHCKPSGGAALAGNAVGAPHQNMIIAF